MVNERSVKYLDGIIHYDGNHSVEFDINEIVIDLNEVEPNIIYEENSSKTHKPPTKTIVKKNTVFRFNYDKDYIKECELDDSYVCANSRKILGYSGNTLYLDKIYLSSDKKVILGLFEHGVYVYKKTYESNGDTCADKSFGNYEIKNDKVYLTEKASVTCNSCVFVNNTSDKIFVIENNNLLDNISNNTLMLQNKYSNSVVEIAYELGYFDGNIICENN